MYQHNTLPPTITKFLWDVDLAQLDLTNNYQSTIEKILEYGDLEAWKALYAFFPEEKIVETIKNSRRLSAKTATFFTQYYKLSPNEVQSLKQPFMNKQNRF